MSNIYRNSLIGLLLIFIPATGYAMKPPKSGNLAIIMQNGKPCFYYPPQKSYSFSSLYISKSSPESGGGWAIQIKAVDRKGLLNPNRPETCVKYGVQIPGTEIVEPAKSLQLDTPYSARLYTNTTSGTSDEMRYPSNFCLTHNAKGETILVNAAWDEKKQSMICLKPGEIPKRSFWQKLFGK
jgi:hypothetical protein